MTPQVLPSRIKKKKLQREIFRLCKIYELLLVAFHAQCRQRIKHSAIH